MSTQATSEGLAILSTSGEKYQIVELLTEPTSGKPVLKFTRTEDPGSGEEMHLELVDECLLQEALRLFPQIFCWRAYLALDRLRHLLTPTQLKQMEREGFRGQHRAWVESIG